MAICMRIGRCHEHTDTCDAEAADGRSTTVLHVRLSDDVARQIRDKVANSRKGYGSISEFIQFILDTQVLRKR